MEYLILFFTFFKIGAFTFGGGYAMLPLIEEEVLKHGWLSMSDLINFIAVSESTPGPFAVNISTYIGSETGGFLGAVCASLGVVLPSFIIILIVAKCYLAFRKNRYVAGCMSGIRPAVIGLIGSAVISVGKNVFFPNGVSLANTLTIPVATSAGILVIMGFLTYKKIHPIYIILASAVLGIIAGLLGII